MSVRPLDTIQVRLKSVLRKMASQVSIETYERLMFRAMLRTAFKELSSAPLFNNREQLWSECVGKWIGRDTRMMFVEFGVYQGRSINYFSNLNANPQSVFIGLDSFEGLPEAYQNCPKGEFDVGGRVPQTKDPRVRFIKGWFQDTWDVLNANLTDPCNLVVHYDCDLYSSTLFALSKIDTLKTEYLAIFDEFAGHECRALYNYLQSYNASVVFLGQRKVDGHPIQVMCRISPKKPSGAHHAAPGDPRAHPAGGRTQGVAAVASSATGREVVSPQVERPTRR